MIELEVCKCDPNQEEIRRGDFLGLCNKCKGAKPFPKDPLPPPPLQPPKPLAPTVWPEGR